MKRIICSVIFIGLFLAVPACGPFPVSRPDTPTAEPTPSALRPTTLAETVNMAVGERLQYLLDENASTGYQWVVTIADPSVLKLEDTSYVSDDAPEDWTGVGGTLTLTFIALNVGETNLVLSYQRDEQDVDQTHKILVVVE